MPQLRSKRKKEMNKKKLLTATNIVKHEIIFGNTGFGIPKYL